VTIQFRDICPTCKGLRTVETSPIYWGATAEDSSPAECDDCPQCRGIGKIITEIRDLDRKPEPVEEYDPWADVA